MKKTIFTLILFISSISLYSQCNGNLDNTFDDDGVTYINITSGDNFGNSLAIQSDGKILAGGYFFNSGQNIGHVTRLECSLTTGMKYVINENIKVFPNPSFENEINISNYPKNEKLFYSLSNFMGRIVQSGMLKEKINIHNKGFFILNIYNETNDIVNRKKILIY